MPEISCAEKTMLLLTYLLSPQLGQLHLELRGLTRLHGVRPGEDASAHRRGDRTADHAVEPVVVLNPRVHWWGEIILRPFTPWKLSDIL